MELNIHDNKNESEEHIPNCITNLENEFINTDYINNSFNEDYVVAAIVNYQENYTVKMLKHIVEYYGQKCSSRTRKQDLIDCIVEFENDILNEDIVLKRRLLWSYMDALLDDNYMKKFVINMN